MEQAEKEARENVEDMLETVSSEMSLSTARLAKRILGSEEVLEKVINGTIKLSHFYCEKDKKTVAGIVMDELAKA